ncbi:MULTISPECIES: FtsB family cell division protein [Gluconobacter]|uniref:Septation inhibitor protein n=4 Tax=Gluconobacter TaxID=441 RepID=A0A149UAR9_GLUOY|nr:septum formation initiator family protein [Gluconobacter oxydans]MBF0852077.1 septation inhibitor protein [Gluconobacter sp. R75690]MBF0865295.1 septation inhibitor protein [Gluconobacter sp. R71656]MBF0868441.1 septation inhibitor protein [Gluconobacter sp. R75628]MBF0874423.1 septation inhibitor protein [Gluconobacter sp. R75629]MBF0880654.1 septation inhibitor protein [Gluconobacter sp. R75828]MBF0883414.1 septation inhibitor protein [Gluconobacter potus]
MTLIRLIKRGVRAVAPPAFFLSLTAYFGWNALHGAHGIHAYQEQMQLQKDALQARQDADDEQNVWRRRVVALKEKALDADMLDERARATMNLTRSGDLVVPYGPHDKLF